MSFLYNNFNLAGISTEAKKEMGNSCHATLNFIILLNNNNLIFIH